MPNKVISISFSEQHIERLNDLKVKIGAGQSEILRRAIDLLYKKEMGDEPRSEAPSRIAKRERDQAFDRFVNMNAQEATAELERIGYLVRDELHPVSGMAIKNYIGAVDGALCLICEMGGSKTSVRLNTLYNEIKEAYKKFYNPKK